MRWTQNIIYVFCVRILVICYSTGTLFLFCLFNFHNFMFLISSIIKKRKWIYWNENYYLKLKKKKNHLKNGWKSRKYRPLVVCMYRFEGQCNTLFLNMWIHTWRYAHSRMAGSHNMRELRRRRQCHSWSYHRLHQWHRCRDNGHLRMIVN